MKNFRFIFFQILLSLILYSCASFGGGGSRSAAPMSHESGELAHEDGTLARERMVTYSATLELSVKDTEETRNVLIQQVKTYDGFITRESNTSITARVPSEYMDIFLSNAKTLGRTENQRRTGTDITDRHRDNVIRLESLKSIRDRYMTLLERANSVSDILSIEKELERINTDIEILEGRIRGAELSVSYSNITVVFRERAKPGPVGWVFYGLYRGIRWLFVWS